MRSGNFRLYVFLAVLALFVVMPVVRSTLQEVSLGQDLRRIRMEYSMYGAEAFRARLDDLVRRAPLDPTDVEIQMVENRREANVMGEIRYQSRMTILFFPVARPVVVREELPLVPL